MKLYGNFIDGRLTDHSAASSIDVLNPATGQPVARVSAASDEESLAAVHVAARAQKSWAALPAIQRGDGLRRLADEVERRVGAIAVALASESGKSLADATAEVGYGIDLLRFHAEWARRIEGEIIESDNVGETLMLMRAPIGVVACLIPFNFPIYTLIRKVAPALITGNAVIVRPSNMTPVSAFIFAEAVAAAALPDGLVNILTMTHEVARTLCSHSAVGMITLTGSVGAGQAVLDYCKVNIAKPSLELGGKTPVIIEPETDLDAVAARIIAAKTHHCGQVCTSVERLYVQASVHDALLAKLRSGFAARKFGDRASHPDHMGPLASAAARDRVHGMVERAIAEGATLETGGVVPPGGGFFYPPTLLSGCRHDMEIVREEVFGPVLAVIRYDAFSDALAQVNDHQYGLAAVLFSENYRTIMQATGAIESGELYVNRFPGEPYQGYHAGWKRSGLGGDDGKHGMLEFTQTRLVILNH